MIDFKKTTQAFSSARQNQVVGNERNQAMSADEAARLLGDDGNVGDYLNKITNPNHVKAPRVKGHGRNELNKDDFLKLMLAQMKHQDPTNPLKSHEMAAQMAQFTSVEQLTNINQGIEAMATQKGGHGGGGSYDALGFIGKVASGDSSKIYRVDGDKGHEFGFELMGDALDVNIQVKDAAGNLVKTLELKNLKKGRNSVNWNGVTEDGLQARAGDYYFTVDARTMDGKKIHAQTQFEGRINGVKFSPQGPILLIGERAVRMQDIRQLVDPTINPNLGQTSKGQNPAGISAQDLKQGSNRPENVPIRKQAATGNIGSIPMDRGLMNKLDKVTK